MKNLSIKASLIALMSAIIVTISVFSFVSLHSINSLKQSTERVGNHWIGRLIVVRDLKDNYADVRLGLARIGMVSNETQLTAAVKRLEEGKSNLAASIAEYESGPVSGQGRALIDAIKASTQAYLQESNRFIALIQEKRIDEAEQVFDGDMRSHASEANRNVGELVTFITDRAHSDVTDAEAEAGQAFFGTVTVAVVAVLISLTGMYFAVARVANPIQRITDAMRSLAGGDVDSEVPYAGRRDEIGAMAGAVGVFRDNAIERIRLEQETEANRSLSEKERIAREEQKAQEAADVKYAVDNLASGLEKLSDGDVSYRIGQPFVDTLDSVRMNFNHSAEKLQTALVAVAQNARAIDGGANEIASAANDLAKRTEQQAAAVEETAAALEEITTTVKDSSRRAQEAGDLVSRAKAGAEQSGIVVGNAVTAMEHIAQSSSEINNILGVIDDIAFQTNLLALNAGVEAARAGDAGKGFAVVAQEVRELAQRSATAAKEIKELISTSNSHVNQGVKLVGETGQALQKIVSEVQEINQHVAAIVESAHEQSSGLQQINTAVNQMDQDTQKNAAMVEESTAASHSLAREVASLNDLLSQFKLGEGKSGEAKVRSASTTDRPATSPARALGRKIASAFNGNAAVKGDWQEF